MNSDLVITVVNITSDKHTEDVLFNCIRSYLEMNGVTVSIINLEFDTDVEVDFNTFINSNAMIYARPKSYSDLKAIVNIGRVKFVKCLCLGGGFVTTNYQFIIDNFILNGNLPIIIILDFDEEQTIFELLREGICNLNFSSTSVNSIIYFDDNKEKIIKRPSRPLNSNLYNFSFDEKYYHLSNNNHNYPILTSMGCNSNCAYCSVFANYKKEYPDSNKFWRERNVTDIINEIEFVSLRQGKNRIRFICEQFFGGDYAGTKHVEQIAKEIVKRKLPIKFSFVSRAVDLHRNIELLPLLKEAGLETVIIGIDSGIQKFLDLYTPGGKVEYNFAVLESLNKENILFDICFIFYDPYLTINGIKENIEFLKKIIPLFSHIDTPYSLILDQHVLSKILILKPGMPIIDRLKSDKLIKDIPSNSFPKYISKFKYEEAGKVYTLYRELSKTTLSSYRQYLYNKELINSNDNLNIFLLNLVEFIVKIVEKAELFDKEKHINILNEYIENYFKPFQNNQKYCLIKVNSRK